MFLFAILIRVFQTEAVSEDPQFLEGHREPGCFSLTPSRSEHWDRNKVEKELGNLNFSFCAFFKIRFS